MVEKLSLIKKVMTPGVRLRDPEDLTRGIQHFFLGKKTVAHRKTTSTAADKYSKVVGGGATS